MFHDAKVAELVNEFMQYKRFTNFELEHEYRSNLDSRYSDSYSYYPDAIVEYDHDDKTWKLGIELELTQKSQSRISYKFEKGIKDCELSHIFYFFPDKKIFDRYVSIFKESFEESHRGKFLFFWSESFINGDYNFNEVTGYYNQQEKNLGSICKMN